MDPASKSKRMKVKLQFAEKLFYEKALSDWRDNVITLEGNKNHAFVLKKALYNLKLFPLDINGFTELRKIRGIGVDIATRLDAAWKHACAVHFDAPSPNIEQIKALKKGEALAILEESTKQNGTGRLPFVSARNRGTQTQKSKKDATKSNALERDDKPMKNALPRSASHELLVPEANSSDIESYECLLNNSVSQPAMSFEFEEAQPINNKLPVSSSAAGFISSSQPCSSASLNIGCSSSSSSSSNSNNHCSPSLSNLQHSPEQFGQSRLLLITDNREHVAGARSRRTVKGIGEHLLAMNVPFESRVLSVGDYLWVLQWKDWTGKQHELVLDYVVERKTFDDLKRSIRETRYMEQKQRLRHCGLRNVVMVVEGTTNADRSLEQAMVSTGIESDFLVHRTANLQGTAKFLQHLTKRLEERCSKEKISGPSFDALQEECKKSHAVTVADCWLRQLTVCPGMSVDRAQQLVRHQHFPSFRSLVELYRAQLTGDASQGEKFQSLLCQTIPNFSNSVSKQLHAFLHRALNDE